MNVKGKKILVLGLMRSGIAVSELLIQHGAKLILCDQKDTHELRAKIDNFKNRVEAIHLGTDPSLYLDEI
ncbi:MAG: UDP-N-acetylmuramoyl-L-alanine--D-glutamate ligase, partial [Christensenellaceae bacterium]|nr:UDP-N-acetylmuramoyl-L-alanine--D-glutamate ligase [Christensenellaceae bacterium]